MSDLQRALMGGRTDEIQRFLRQEAETEDYVVSVRERQYGARGDGVTDDTTAFQNALLGVAANKPNAKLIVPRGRYVIRGALNVPSGITIEGVGRSSVLIQDHVNTYPALFVAAGTVGTRTALGVDALVGTYDITLPSAQGAQFSVGDFIEFQSTTIVYGTTGRARDIRRVLEVTGDVVRIEGTLIHSFLVSASATFAKVAPVKDVTISDLAFVSTDPATYTNFTIQTQIAYNVNLTNLMLTDMGGGLSVTDTLNSRVNNVVVDRLRNGWKINPTNTGRGYAVFLAGACAHVEIAGLKSNHVRHAVTTLSYQSDESTFWGGPRDCTIRDCFSIQDAASSGLGTSHFDTHEFGSNIQFVNCVANGGGEAGFQVRAQRVKLINCVALRCGTRGVSATNLASDVEIIGGEYAYNTLVGVSMSATGLLNSVKNANIHRNQQAGIGMAGNILISGCTIVENGQNAAQTYGIQDLGTTGARIIGNVIPKSESTFQNVAILSLAATGVATGNQCTGYGATNAFFNAAAGAKIEGNITDLAGVLTKTSAYTIAPGDDFLVCDATSAAFTITLPTAVGYKGRKITIKRINAAANAVTVGTTSSQTIDGVTTYSLAAQWATVIVVSNGTNWYIAAKF